MANAEKLKELFLAAIELNDVEREHFLEHHCGANVQLKEQLRGLIKAHNGSGKFLRSPETTIDQPAGLATTIGDTVPHQEEPESQSQKQDREKLRWRMRILAILQLLNVASFLPVIYGRQEVYYSPEIMGQVTMLLYWVYAIWNGVLTVSLRAKFNWSLVQLRVLDGLTIALVVVMLASLTHSRLVQVMGLPAEGPEHRASMILFVNFNTLVLCMMTILIYGAVIPTTTRLQVYRLGSLVLFPIGAIAFAASSHEELASRFSLLFFSAVSILGTAAAVIFSTTVRVNRLSQEVAEVKKELREVGQYQLGKHLGSGGMGEVYQAEHRHLKRPCAVKLIRPEMASKPEFLGRFDREVKAMTLLSHPSAIQVYDYGQNADGVYYYAMEYVPGWTLVEVLERSGPQPIDRIVAILRQLCGALAEAHALGLIHRDLKPGNIMLYRRSGRMDTAKLLDFGLVTQMGTEDTRLTQAGSLLGTPAYMSPEQASGETVLTAGSDLYSLGGVAYFLLTGRPPFPEDNTLKLLQAHISEPAQPPSRHRSTIPPGLDAIVLCLLQKRPAERFQTAAELESALAQVPSSGDWDEERSAVWWQQHQKD